MYSHWIDIRRERDDKASGLQKQAGPNRSWHPDPDPDHNDSAVEDANVPLATAAIALDQANEDYQSALGAVVGLPAAGQALDDARCTIDMAAYAIRGALSELVRKANFTLADVDQIIAGRRQ